MYVKVRDMLKVMNDRKYWYCNYWCIFVFDKLVKGNVYYFEDKVKGDYNKDIFV